MKSKEERDLLRLFVFMGTAILHSALASCDRLRAGCVIVKDKVIRGVGYNNPLPGMPHCDEVGHKMEEGHCVRTRHAEKNALTFTPAEHKNGGQAIITATPCVRCVTDLVAEKIARVDYLNPYGNVGNPAFIKEISEHTGLIIQQHDIDIAELFKKVFDQLAKPGGELWFAGYRINVTKEPI